MPPSKDLLPFREEFFSLVKESDPALLQAGLLGLATRLQSSDQEGLAQEIYSAFGVPAKIGRSETWLRHFLQDTLSPSSLLGMGVAGLACRATRFGVLAKLLANPEASLWTRGLGARAVAGGLGFLAEVPSFTLTTELSRSMLTGQAMPNGSALSQALVGSALFLGGAKLGSQGSSALLEGLGLGASAGAQALAYGGQFTGILMGRGLERYFRNEAHETPLWIDSLVTFLQLQIAARMSQALLGPSWQSLERHLDLAARQLETPTSPPQSFSPAFAGASGPWVSQESGDPVGKLFFRPLLSEARDLASSEAQQKIADSFRSQFPEPAASNYSEEILSTVATTPFPKASWAQVLLESLATSPQRGDLSQLFTVDAIKKVFNYDALNNGGGSFGHAVLQYVLERSLEEPSLHKRQNMLRVIAFAMERGTDRTYWTKLAQMANYHVGMEVDLIPIYDDFFRRAHHREIKRELEELSPSHRDMVINFIYELYPERSVRASALFQAFGQALRRYPRGPMETALDYALRHPLGKLILRRIVTISAGREPAFKIQDLRSLPQHEKSEEEILRMLQEGWKPEVVAAVINGTHHTGYLYDLRVARKLVATVSDLQQWREKPLHWRQAAKQRLRAAIQQFASTGAPLDPGMIWRLLMLNGSHLVADAFQSARYRRFDLEILSDTDFDEVLQRCGLSAQSDVAVFIKANPQFPRDRVVIRDLPGGTTPTSPHRPEDILLRLMATAHELEHWRHFSGNFAPGEIGQKPFQFYNGKLSEEHRLASEIMASLEEERWLAFNSDGPTEQARSAQRLGQSLTFFLRDFNDWSYFGAKRNKGLEGLLPPLRQ